MPFHRGGQRQNWGASIRGALPFRALVLLGLPRQKPESWHLVLSLAAPTSPFYRVFFLHLFPQKGSPGRTRSLQSPEKANSALRLKAESIKLCKV